jgi:hypothetical protein
MLTIILAIILGSGSRQSVPSQQVDLIELNHCLSDCGTELFTQVIFREWSPEYRRHDVVAWSIPSSLDEMPRLVGGAYEVRVKKSHCRPIVVKSAKFIETTTIGDPERLEKRLLDEKLRYGLMSIGEK